LRNTPGFIISYASEIDQTTSWSRHIGTVRFSPPTNSHYLPRQRTHFMRCNLQTRGRIRPVFRISQQGGGKNHKGATFFKCNIGCMQQPLQNISSDVVVKHCTAQIIFVHLLSLALRLSLCLR